MKSIGNTNFLPPRPFVPLQTGAPRRQFASVGLEGSHGSEMGMEGFQGAGSGLEHLGGPSIAIRLLLSSLTILCSGASDPYRAAGECFSDLESSVA